MKSVPLDGSSRVLPILALWALPFLWIGVSMSMRRALDAGRSAWLALLFFIPVVNWIFLLVMCLLPSAAEGARIIEITPADGPIDKARVGMALGAGVAIGVGVFGLSMLQDSAYSAPLFLGTPFVMGAVTALLLNRGTPMSGRTTQQLVLVTMVITGVVLFAIGGDGLTVSSWPRRSPSASRPWVPPSAGMCTTEATSRMRSSGSPCCRRW